MRVYLDLDQDATASLIRSAVEEDHNVDRQALVLLYRALGLEGHSTIAEHPAEPDEAVA